jgi:hypothetical protein
MCRRRGFGALFVFPHQLNTHTYEHRFLKLCHPCENCFELGPLFTALETRQELISVKITKTREFAPWRLGIAY